MNMNLMENTQSVRRLKPSRVLMRHGVRHKMSFQSARSQFPDPVGLWLTNLLVIRLTRTPVESPGKTATRPRANIQKAEKRHQTGRERLTEIISSFLHCWDRSRMPLTKSLLALTYVFPASIIPLHSFTSCRGQRTDVPGPSAAASLPLHTHQIRNNNIKCYILDCSLVLFILPLPTLPVNYCGLFAEYLTCTSTRWTDCRVIFIDFSASVVLDSR